MNEDGKISDKLSLNEPQSREVHMHALLARLLCKCERRKNVSVSYLMAKIVSPNESAK